MRLFFLALLAVLTLATCNRKVAGPNAGTATKKTRLRVAEVLREVEANRTTAEWLDARAKVDVASDDLNIGGNAYLRLHRDDAIWMSVKKFGFEGARALIRTDSFFLYNRLEGEYIAEPLSYIEEKYDIPARFDLLQEIFFGNPAFLTDELDLTTADDGVIRLTGRDQQFAADYRIDPQTYRLRRMELTELGEARALTVTNGDYREEPGQLGAFPRRRTIEVNGGSEGTARLDMEFTEVSFAGPLAMPFTRR
jgi:hypothetical protein